MDALRLRAYKIVPGKNYRSPKGDRNLYRGRHLASLRRIFRRRGIGPVE